MFEREKKKVMNLIIESRSIYTLELKSALRQVVKWWRASNERFKILSKFEDKLNVFMEQRH